MMDQTLEDGQTGSHYMDHNAGGQLRLSTEIGIQPYDYNDPNGTYDGYHDAPTAPFDQPQAEEAHQFIGGSNVPEPTLPSSDDYFPQDDSPSDGLLDPETDDGTSMATEEYETRLNTEVVKYWSLMPVMTEIPDPFGPDVLATSVDPVISTFSDAFEQLKARYDAASSLKEKADLYEPVRALWEEWLYLWANHIITAPQSLDEFVHVLRVKIPPFLAYTSYAYNSLPSTKTKIKNFEKNASVYIVREPAPCAAAAKIDEGPFIFEIVLRPGVVLTKPTMVRATGVACQYADWDIAEENGTRGAAGKDTAPGVTHSALKHLEGDLYMIEKLCFNTTSSGRVFEVDFVFTFYHDDPETKRASNFEVRTRSLPMACLSNIGSQWASGEGRYVANLAFGLCNTKSSPSAEIRYPALANALQFTHLTCTRQIGSAYFIEKLAKKGEEAKRHFERKKTNAASGRSAQARVHLDLHVSFVTYKRVLRVLTVEEIRAVFPPNQLAPQASLKLPKFNGGAFSAETMPAPDSINAHGMLELISYESFCKNWKWYGALMYKLYTGQIDGMEIRSLWLRGLIHLVPPVGGSPIGILDHRYVPGTVLIRTSRQEGTFTYAFVQARTGDPTIDYVCKPVEVSGNDYSSTLHNEGAILSLVNIAGAPIDKEVVVRAYKAITQLPPARDSVSYTRGLFTLPQSFGDISLAPFTP